MRLSDLILKAYLLVRRGELYFFSAPLEEKPPHSYEEYVGFKPSPDTRNGQWVWSPTRLLKSGEELRGAVRNHPLAVGHGDPTVLDDMGVLVHPVPTMEALDAVTVQSRIQEQAAVLTNTKRATGQAKKCKPVRRKSKK